MTTTSKGNVGICIFPSFFIIYSTIYTYTMDNHIILGKLTNLFMLYLTIEALSKGMQNMFFDKKISRVGGGEGGETQIFL